MKDVFSNMFWKLSHKIRHKHIWGVHEKKEERGMTIELIFKIAAVGILVTILGQVLKHSGREEQAFLVSLAGLFIVLSWIIPCISELFSEIYSLFQL